MNPDNSIGELLRENADLKAWLEEARATIRAILAGDLDTIVVPGPKGEQLYSRRGVERPYRLLIEQFTDGAATLSGDGLLLFSNQRLAALLCKPLEKLIGNSFLDHVADGERASFEHHVAQASEQNMRGEFTLQADDGTRIVVLISFTSVLIDEARVVFLVITDLRPQKQEAERLRKHTAQLEVANRELESFTYSVSHDLRSPLRAMNGFAHILINEYAACLPEEARRYLNLIRQNSKQLDRLLDDLLAFTRLGRQALHQQTVAPADLVRQIVADLRTHEPDRRVDVQIGDLPVCQADPAMLKQVLVHLLDNAFKYTRGRDVARIEVGYGSGACKRGQPAYFVRDNGVGFDMAYVGKLFGVFQRLHRLEDDEGTGVGLALVKRIIERHGGRVCAEGAVDQGATFSFTLGGSSLHD